MKTRDLILNSDLYGGVLGKYWLGRKDNNYLTWAVNLPEGSKYEACDGKIKTLSHRKLIYYVLGKEEDLTIVDHTTEIKPTEGDWYVGNVEFYSLEEPGIVHDTLGGCLQPCT